MNKLIDSYKEMLELIIHARLAFDRVDEWKETLDLVINSDQHEKIVQLKTNSDCHNINQYPDRVQFYKDYL